MDKLDRKILEDRFYEVDGAQDMLLALVAKLGVELALTKCGSVDPLEWLEDIRDKAAAEVVSETAEAGT